ncbi:MAG: acyl carrier protein [Anaerolineaceae bacterium]
MVREKIRNYIGENILFSSNGFPYADETSFLETGIIDSMNVLELVVFIEENFGITVEDSDFTPDNFDSVEKIENFISRKTEVESA